MRGTPAQGPLFSPLCYSSSLTSCSLLCTFLSHFLITVVHSLLPSPVVHSLLPSPVVHSSHLSSSQRCAQFSPFLFSTLCTASLLLLVVHSLPPAPRRGLIHPERLKGEVNTPGEAKERGVYPSWEAKERGLYPSWEAKEGGLYPTLGM